MTGSASLVDAAGTVHQPAGDDARIVCLVPSITELVCDLGLGAQLVGRTGFCIHPSDVVRTIPKVGGTKDVRLDRVRELAPTHVIVNVDENLRETADALADFGATVVVTHPRQPRDNLDLFRLLGAIFNRQAQAEQLCEAFERTRRQVTARPRTAENVLYLIWREPWMSVARDTYISRTLALFNLHTVPADSEARYPEVHLESFAGSVDRVLLSSEPYHFRERHLQEVAACVPGAAVSLIDGEMTSWYGSRAIAGLRYLAEFVGRAAP